MITIPHPIESTALARPHHPVLEADGHVWSARELRHQVAMLAGLFAARDIRAGDRVGLRGSPSAHWILSFHALGWLGAVAVPLSREVDTLALNLRSTIETGELSQEQYCNSHLKAPPERFWALDEPRLIIHGSGSSQRPRPIELSTAQLLFTALGSAIRLGHLPTDRWLCCLPLYHIGGAAILLRCAWYGTTVVLANRFDAHEIAQWLDSGNITQVSLVPTMLQRILDVRAAEPFPDTLRCVLLGGGAIKAELVRRCRDLQIPLAATWGMTETASQVATAFPGETDLRVLPFARIDVHQGELHVRGPIVRGEILATSDRGRIEPDGEVVVLGRKDRVILSGGKKIDPEEVEATLLRHPAVLDAVVVGEPDEEWGEHPLAIVALNPDKDRPKNAELDQWCRRSLESYKRPRRWVMCSQIPRNAMGKLTYSSLKRLMSSEEPPPRDPALQGGDMRIPATPSRRCEDADSQ